MQRPARWPDSGCATSNDLIPPRFTRFHSLPSAISLFMIPTSACNTSTLRYSTTYFTSSTTSSQLYFQYFIIPAFFYFLLSTTCDMKLLWIVWKDRFDNNLMDQQQQRRQITIFFIQFCILHSNLNFLDTALISYFVLMYFLQLSDAFILLNSLFFVPQIVHNAQRGNNPKFISTYILGVLGSTMLLPVSSLLNHHHHIALLPRLSSQFLGTSTVHRLLHRMDQPLRSPSLSPLRTVQIRSPLLHSQMPTPKTIQLLLKLQSFPRQHWNCNPRPSIWLLLRKNALFVSVHSSWTLIKWSRTSITHCSPRRSWSLPANTNFTWPAYAAGWTLNSPARRAGKTFHPLMTDHYPSPPPEPQSYIYLCHNY